MEPVFRNSYAAYTNKFHVSEQLLNSNLKNGSNIPKQTVEIANKRVTRSSSLKNKEIINLTESSLDSQQKNQAKRPISEALVDKPFISQRTIEAKKAKRALELDVIKAVQEKKDFENEMSELERLNNNEKERRNRLITSIVNSGMVSRFYDCFPKEQLEIALESEDSVKDFLEMLQVLQTALKA